MFRVIIIRREEWRIEQTRQDIAAFGGDQKDIFSLRLLSIWRTVSEPTLCLILLFCLMTSSMFAISAETSGEKSLIKISTINAEIRFDEQTSQYQVDDIDTWHLLEIKLQNKVYSINTALTGYNYGYKKDLFKAPVYIESTKYSYFIQMQPPQHQHHNKLSLSGEITCQAQVISREFKGQTTITYRV